MNFASYWNAVVLTKSKQFLFVLPFGVHSFAVKFENTLRFVSLYNQWIALKLVMPIENAIIWSHPEWTNIGLSGG